MTTSWKKNRVKALQRGDQIGIVSPSGPIEKKNLVRGKAQLFDWGFQPVVHENALKRHLLWGGSDAERLAGLLDFVTAKYIKAVWFTRGGSGITRLLPLLEEKRFCEKLRRNPKPVLGFSDATALLLYIWTRLRMPSVHSPTVAGDNFFTLSRAGGAHLQEILLGEMPLGVYSRSMKWPTKFLLGPRKSVEGVLLGGNLSMVTSMLGTKYQPDLSGSLLFLEEVAEPPYRVDRMLNQLAQAGVFKGVRAVILGDMQTNVPRTWEKNGSVKEIVQEFLHGLGLPVLHGLPVGHGRRNEAMPHGIRARITAAGKIQFLEQVAKQ